MNPIIENRFARGEMRLAMEHFTRTRPQKIPMLDEEMPHCNDNCMHCGVAEIMEEAVMMPLERVVQHLLRLYPLSGKRVMFGVSELTIRPDFLSIVRAAKKIGYKTVAVVSNGRRFSDPRFGEAALKAGMTHVLLSIYGPGARIHEGMTRTPGSFEQTVAGLSWLLEHEVKVMTNSVVTLRNQDSLSELVAFLGDLGVRNSCLSFVQKIGNAKRFSAQLIPSWKEAVPAMEKAYRLGVERGMVMGLGGIPPCALPQYPEAFGVDDLTWIHNGEARDQIRERSPYHYAIPCGDCALRPVCHGVQEEALVDEDMGQLNPFSGPICQERPRSALGYAMFPDLFDGEGDVGRYS